jgi:hypothetical protein
MIKWNSEKEIHCNPILEPVSEKSKVIGSILLGSVMVE